MEQDTSPGEDSKSAPTVPAENPSLWSRGDDGKGNQERLSDPEDGITRRDGLSRSDHEAEPVLITRLSRR